MNTAVSVSQWTISQLTISHLQFPCALLSPIAFAAATDARKSTIKNPGFNAFSKISPLEVLAPRRVLNLVKARKGFIFYPRKTFPLNHPKNDFVPQSFCLSVPSFPSENRFQFSCFCLGVFAPWRLT